MLLILLAATAAAEGGIEKVAVAAEGVGVFSVAHAKFTLCVALEVSLFLTLAAAAVSSKVARQFRMQKRRRRRRFQCGGGNREAAGAACFSLPFAKPLLLLLLRETLSAVAARLRALRLRDQHGGRLRTRAGQPKFAFEQS
jgi:hypothetical protein